ncbi:MAG: hypothetical protein M1812_007054 [Candelaria pacifica]|nr:MAG: hypothetical protein M1812_007054 [Candelaria pacifica]
MDDPALASLSLTHVHYNPADPISYICAWLALVPQGLCVIYVTLIWSTREIEILLMFAGQMGCEALNFLLKRWIKEERPRQLGEIEMNGKGYGMPSSHAQFATFFSISLSLFLLFRHVPHHPQHTQQTSTTHTPTTLLERILLSILALLGAGAVSASRIYLNYHTPKQVFVGCLAGGISAILWFGFTTFLRRWGWIEWGLDLPLARMLRMRDLVVEEDLVDAGWVQWEERRRRKRNLRGDGVGKKGR